MHKAFLDQVVLSAKHLDTLQEVDTLMFMDLLAATQYFPNPQTRRRLQARIRTYCLKKLGVDMMWRPLVKVQYSAHVSLAQLRNTLNQLLAHLPFPPATIQHFCDRARIVFTKINKLVYSLCNYKLAAKDHSSSKRWPCTCCNQPDAMKDATGHVNCTGQVAATHHSDLAIFSINAKNAVKPNAELSSGELAEVLMEFITQQMAPMFPSKQLPESLRTLVEQVHQKAKECIKEGTHAPVPFFTGMDVLKAKAVIKQMGVVVSTLDKNAGRFHVMCAQAWHTTYDQLFTDDTHYEAVEASAAEVLEYQRVQYNSAKLEKIAPWNYKGQLPLAHFFTKDKNMQRQRPVLAMVNHPTRVATRVCAKGGTLMIRMASGPNSPLKHFNIQSCAGLWRSLWAPDVNPNGVFPSQL